MVSRASKRSWSFDKYGKKPALVWIAAFAVIGCITLLVAKAATSVVAFEAEAGARSGSVQPVSDTGASGNAAILFGAGGGSNCGLAGEVFCENFEQGPVAAANRFRSGDFDSTKISASRFFGDQYFEGEHQPNWVRTSEIPACRTGSVTHPLPPNDTLICEPTTTIGTRYGLTGTAAQNYGDNQYRISQPFDIAARTGTIAFDASLHTYNGIVGYTTIMFSSEPVASGAIATGNGAGTSMKEGFFISFFCDGGGAIMVKYSNYVETDVPNELGICNNPGMTTKVGNLNRVQIKVSQTRVEIYATDYSTNGLTYGTPKLIYRGNPGLSFTRGFVAFGNHNHASIKYGGPNSSYTGGVTVPSINTVWDNIAFDGPALTAKTYQVPDAGTIVGNGMTLGYYVPDLSGTAMTPLTIKSVSTSGVTSAKLAFNVYVNPSNKDPNTYKVHYRLNGGTWHEATFPAELRSRLISPGSNRFNITTGIDKNELVNGDNTLQIATQNIAQDGYGTFAANIDVLTF